MVFSSIIFLILFLPVTLLCYYSVRGVYRNIILLITSLFFYAWGEGIYLLLMLFSIVLNYCIGCAIGEKRAGKEEESTQKRRTIILAFGISLNLLILGYFKYAHWLFAEIAHISFFAEPIHLPIGISFFTFQALSYIIDVYRGEVPPQKNPLNLGLYIASFPQLIAGPIVRYSDVAIQIVSRKHSAELFVSGMERFIFGLSKKVLLANSMAQMADFIFTQNYTYLSVSAAWFGIICYTLQIYFDFSGYSDMAIGLGRMFGFQFTENFNYPYIARSIQEFWRRWHISLSSWFRDYLYIPLGGNRAGKLKTYRNLLLVFFLCGLWHGASWNFIIWGCIHGCFIIVERNDRIRGVLQTIPSFFASFYTMFIVVNAWVFFRVESFLQAINYLKAMYGLKNISTATIDISIQLKMDSVFILFLIASFLFAMPVYGAISNKIQNKLSKSWLQKVGILKYLLLLFLLYSSFSFLAVNAYNPFIYFRF